MALLSVYISASYGVTLPFCTKVEFGNNNNFDNLYKTGLIEIFSK